MSVNSLGTPMSGMQVNAFRQAVSANNIANVNTDGFQASTVQTGDNAYINSIGTGTQVMATYAPPMPGALAPATAPTTAATATAPATGATNGNPTAVGGMVELSNTDMVTEMTNQMNARSAYGVNTAMSRTVDEATQTLMNLRG